MVGLIVAVVLPKVMSILAELIIQRAMDGLTKGRTSFVIAHRLSTIRNAV